MEFPKDLKYTKKHEWIRIEDDEGVIGITDYAQSELGDIVYVELPEVGDEFDKEDEFGSVESVKATSELYMPLSGEILEINEELEDAPEMVNSDPYGKAWFVRISIANSSDLDDLLDSESYEELIK